jgi:sulfur relay (sulfurtransferase) DsrF/TusC family protein
MHKPRKIFPDNFIIMPQQICIKWFDIYDKLELIMNDEIIKKVKLYNETLIINSEELIFAKYLLEFNNLDNIYYF